MKRITKEEIFLALFQLGAEAVHGRSLSESKDEWQFILANGYFARIITNRKPFVFELLAQAKNYHEAKLFKQLDRRFIEPFPIESIAAATRAIFSILRKYEPEVIESDGSEAYE